MYLSPKAFGSGLSSGAAIFCPLRLPQTQLNQDHISSRRPVSLSYKKLEVLKIYFP